jgi:hypothetical protein
LSDSRPWDVVVVVVLDDPNGHHQLPPLKGSGDGVPVAEVAVLDAVDVVFRVVDVMLGVIVVCLVEIMLEVFAVDVCLVELVLEVLIVEPASFEQSVSPHLSLQSFKHISVQFMVPVGHPQPQRSWFARLNAHAPILVPTASA